MLVNAPVLNHLIENVIGFKVKIISATFTRTKNHSNG